MDDVNDGQGDARPAAPADPEHTGTATAPSGPPSALDSDCGEHPGIVIRPGPTGPRAALLHGPDVWDVIAALHALRDEDPALRSEDPRSELRAVTGLTTAQVAATLDYYTAHPVDVDERIADNNEAAERASLPPAADGPPPRGRNT